MHKSKGNAIWFDDAAEIMGVDAMRWLFATVNPARTSTSATAPPTRCAAASSCRSGTRYSLLRHLRPPRRLRPDRSGDRRAAGRAARCSTAGSSPGCNQVDRRQSAQRSTTTTRSRAATRSSASSSTSSRTGTSAATAAASGRARATATRRPPTRRSTSAWSTLTKLLAPFMPFLAEAMYQNLVRSVDADAPRVVHLTDYPAVDAASDRRRRSRADMAAVLEVVRLGRAARSEAERQGAPAAAGGPGLRRASQRCWRRSMRLRGPGAGRAERQGRARRSSELGDVVAYDIRPNLPRARPEVRQAARRDPPARSRGRRPGRRRRTGRAPAQPST